MTNEQSATLLRLNKQAQVAALNAVGFSDVTENSRASEFGQRIKWAAGLLDLHLACNRISDNSKAYLTPRHTLLLPNGTPLRSLISNCISNAGFVSVPMDTPS